MGYMLYNLTYCQKGVKRCCPSSTQAFLHDGLGTCLRVPTAVKSTMTMATLIKEKLLIMVSCLSEVKSIIIMVGHGSVQADMVLTVS